MSIPATLGTCALCHKQKDLCESHIASKFLWKNSGVTGHKRSFSVLSPSHPELNQSNQQDGFKEQLLCEVCEGQFAKYEDYVARALCNRKGPFHNRPGKHYLWTGLDYRKVKLFQMSILWRMSVSKHPFYGMVDLGKHEEILRCMLNSEDPGEPWRYGCIATLLDQGGKPLLGIFSQPLRTKMFGRQCFSYAIAGMYWKHFVTSHPFEETTIDQMLLRPDGTWALFNGEAADFPELQKQIELYRQMCQKL